MKNGQFKKRINHFQGECDDRVPDYFLNERMNMSFNEKTIKNIAQLARLRFPQEDETRFMQDIESILNWVEELKEVDVSDVEPLVSVSPRESAIRPDEVTIGGIRDELMANAPETVHGFYVVPKMVE